MLIPIDLNVNCRVKRQREKTEIIVEDGNQADTMPEDHYRGGSLFGGGSKDDVEL
jgi:hypothetical protein